MGTSAPMHRSTTPRNRRTTRDGPSGPYHPEHLRSAVGQCTLNSWQRSCGREIGGTPSLTHSAAMGGCHQPTTSFDQHITCTYRQTPFFYILSRDPRCIAAGVGQGGLSNFLTDCRLKLRRARRCHGLADSAISGGTPTSKLNLKLAWLSCGTNTQAHLLDNLQIRHAIRSDGNVLPAERKLGPLGVDSRFQLLVLPEGGAALGS